MIRLAPLALLGLLALTGVPALSGCDSGEPDSCDSTAQFSTEDLTPEGTTLGEAVEIGSCVGVDYVGRLADGSGTFDEGSLTFFYSSNARLIPGFVLGMSGQRVGQTRRVVIPPSLGYGTRSREASAAAIEMGRVGIPSCSVLEFDITVTGVFQDARQCQ
ncbi:FKBP-type peptidyl-prolyl cis-trans isomerase [Rubrivirga sp. IMCC43871]|uniref:FKBP-type peptidyl-prolyl cis-trans isomerase n=1 Tax=Rubrivirga sp. IMCC43871 TaxID=3391575 RepID=UPI00398FC0A6